MGNKTLKRNVCGRHDKPSHSRSQKPITLDTSTTHSVRSTPVNGPKQPNLISIRLVSILLEKDRGDDFEEITSYRKGNWITYQLKSRATLEQFCMKKCVFSNAIDASRHAKAFQTYINLLWKKHLTPHPHIAQYFFVQSRNDTVEIIHESSTVGDLETMTKQVGKLQECHVKVLIQQVVDALQYMHIREIIHGNLSCRDLLIDESFQVKIIGYIENLFMAENALHLHLMPCPEIYSGGSMCKATDIWALGCMVLSLLSGKFSPLMETTMINVEESLQSEKMRNEGAAAFIIHLLNISISESCRSFVTMCLQGNPESRPTAAHLQEHPWLSDTKKVLNENKITCFI